MRTNVAACVVAAALLAASFGEAGQGTSPSVSAPPSPEAMGVSLRNIRKSLAESPATASTSKLRYEFRVEVFAKARPINFLEDFDLSKNGGVRYGFPTHADLINAVTPAPFRTYGGVNLLSPRRKD